jgi:hypothetical protein
MKKILLVIGIVMVIGAGIVGVVFYATSGLPESADAFFQQVAQGQASAAYQSTAAEFRAGTSEPEFMQFLKTTALTEYQSASWSSRSIESDRGILEGTVTTTSGGKIPLRVEFVKEDGAWKIYAIRKSQGGVTDETSETTTATPSIPSADAAQVLARDTLMSFSEAIKAKNFDRFYEDLSPIWKQQTNATDLSANFQSFMDANIDLSGVSSASILLSGSSLDENGLLVLNGQAAEVPGPSSHLAFELKYHADAGDWKLVGIQVQTR